MKEGGLGFVVCAYCGEKLPYFYEITENPQDVAIEQVKLHVALRHGDDKAAQ